MADGSRIPITVCNKVLYALPSFVLAVAGIFHAIYQTKYYVDDLGMLPRVFALCNAFVRSAGLLGYVLMGWLIDNTIVLGNPFFRGRRKPFLLLCAPIVAACYFLIYSPPQWLSPAALTVWYSLFATVYNGLPLSLSYAALGTELSQNYDEQASLAGFTHVFACLGMIGGSMIPGLVSATAFGASGDAFSATTAAEAVPDATAVTTAAPAGAQDGASFASTRVHLQFFPLFVFAVAALLAIAFLFLSLRIRTNDPNARPGSEESKRLDDGGLWEQLMSLGRFSTPSRSRAGVALSLPPAPPRKSSDDGEADEGNGGGGGTGKGAGSREGAEEGAYDGDDGDAPSAANLRRRRPFVAAAGEDGGLPSALSLPGRAGDASSAAADASPGRPSASAKHPLFDSANVGDLADAADPDADAACTCPSVCIISLDWCCGSRAQRKTPPPSPSPPAPTGEGQAGKVVSGSGCCRCCRGRGAAEGGDVGASPLFVPTPSVLSAADRESSRLNADVERQRALRLQQSIVAGAISESDWTVVLWPARSWPSQFPTGVVNNAQRASAGAAGSGGNVAPVKGAALAPFSDAAAFEPHSAHPQNVRFDAAAVGVGGGLGVSTYRPSATTGDEGDEEESSLLASGPPAKVAAVAPGHCCASVRVCLFSCWDALCCIPRGQRAYADQVLFKGKVGWEDASSAVDDSAVAGLASNELLEAVVLVRANALCVGDGSSPAGADLNGRGLVGKNIAASKPSDSFGQGGGSSGNVGSSSSSNSDASSGPRLEVSATSVAATPPLQPLPQLLWDPDTWVVVFPRNRLPGESLSSAGGASPATRSHQHPASVSLPPEDARLVAQRLGAIDALSRPEDATGTRLDQPLPIVAGALWGLRSIPFRVILIAFMLLSLAMVLGSSMTAFFVQYVLRPQSYEFWLGILVTVELVVAVCATPIWYAIAQCVDQKWAWVIAIGVTMPLKLVAFFVLGPGDVHLCVAFAAVWGLLEAGSSFLMRAMRTSVTDYDNLYLGKRREGQYLTYLAIFTHWSDIPASGIGLSLLGSAGYVRNAPNNAQNESTTLVIRLLALGVPLCFVFLAWLIILFFPISRAAHAMLFKSRRAAGAAPPPPTPTQLQPPSGAQLQQQQQVLSGAGGGGAASAGTVKIPASAPTPLSPPHPGPSISGPTGSGEGGGGARDDTCCTSRRADAAAVDNNSAVIATARPAATPSSSCDCGCCADDRAAATESSATEGGGAVAVNLPTDSAASPPPPPPCDASQAGSLAVDPVTCAYIYPSFIYRSASSAWLLDHFSRYTLRQVLEYRVQQRALRRQEADEKAADAEREDSDDSDDDDSALPPSPPRGRDDTLPGADGGGGGSSVVVRGSGRRRAAALAAPGCCSRRGPHESYASCCGFLCACLPPFFNVFAREVTLALLWSLAAVGSAVIIALGTRPEFEAASWAAMLLLGLAGLCTGFHALRARPAQLLDFVRSAAIRRHLRLHH